MKSTAPISNLAGVTSVSTCPIFNPQLLQSCQLKLHVPYGRCHGTIIGCYSETIRYEVSAFAMWTLWTKIPPIPHTTPHCAPVTVSLRGEVFSFCPPWFWPMKTWATRIRKSKSTGLAVSACFLLEPTLLWGGLGEDLMKKKWHCWTTV